VGVLLTTTSALLISGFAIVLYDLRGYQQRLTQDLATQSALLGLANASALQFNDAQVASDSLATLQAKPLIVSTAIYDAEGQLFASYVHENAGTEEFPDGVQADMAQVTDKFFIMSRRIIVHGDMLGTIYIKAHYQLYERAWRYAGIVLTFTAVALVISMLLALWLQGRVARPILRITDLARRVAEERDFTLRAEKTTDDEIGYMVDAFNDLLREVGSRSAALESLNAELEQRVGDRTVELERANNELEAFSYSVSHDLRTPLRAIDGFSQALIEDYAEKLDATGRNYLERVRVGAQRMGQLIDDLLKLSRVSRAPLTNESVDLSTMAANIMRELHANNPQRRVEVVIDPTLRAEGDPHLLCIVLENLLSNAWKYSGKREQAIIEFGRLDGTNVETFYIRDNGAGFDMAYANKLFGAFQRLHDAKEFPGTGVGLATVQRIIHRHGGSIWAEGEVDTGSVFYFTLTHRQGAAG